MTKPTYKPRLEQLVCKHMSIYHTKDIVCMDCGFPMKKKSKDYSMYSPVGAIEMRRWLGAYSIVPDWKAWFTK